MDSGNNPGEDPSAVNMQQEYQGTCSLYLFPITKYNGFRMHMQRVQEKAMISHCVKPTRAARNKATANKQTAHLTSGNRSVYAVSDCSMDISTVKTYPLELKVEL